MGEIVLNTKDKEFPVPGKILKIIRNFPFLLSVPVIGRVLRKLLFKRLPNVKNSSISPGFYCISGKNIYAEDVSFSDTGIVDYGKVIIGKNTGFSNKNMIITSTHSFTDFSDVIAKDVIIGENVWITTGCIILGGVKIGDNSVIGAGSVVTKDIPENVFASGNPCRVIKKIERNPMK